MFIGIDDTDSPEGMCTTYIASKLIEYFSDRLIGYPRLVRLNPNIRYKTRGNGALAIQVGAGTGEKIHIGQVGGNPIFSFVSLKAEKWDDDDRETVISLVQEYAEKGDNTNPGIVFSKLPVHPSLYRQALQKEIQIAYVEKLLSSSGADFEKFGNGRGIVGAASAISWKEEPHTFEVLNYNFPTGRRRSITEKLEISNFAESTGITFDSVDNRNRRPAIFPREKTPVVYGVRGVEPDSLIRLSMDINRKYHVESERITTFMTNQATDDHIIPNPSKLEELGSYAIDSYVVSQPYTIKGGHYFFEADYNSLRIKAAAFEPTKEFRRTVSMLRPGDRVRLFGSFVDGTINLEKITVDSISEEFRRSNPSCKKCGAVTANRGKNDYRCPNCGTKYVIPHYVKIDRIIKEGYYEVPVTARRHLSMPLKLKEKMVNTHDMY